MNRKLLALVGRPNVGKSTLFNRLSIDKKAIVYDYPGVTRDRKYADAKIGSLLFNIVDTPGFKEITNELNYQMMQQTIVAINEADLVILVVDSRSGVTADDMFFANFIRKNNKDCMLIVNKSEKKCSSDKEFYTLGFGEPIYISAKHKQGFIDLYDALSLKIGTVEDSTEKKNNNPSILKVAVVGRPNCGKSTFINAILKEKRVNTQSEAGTTRESIEIKLEYKNLTLNFVDTAGLRKRANVIADLEKLSRNDTINTIRFANTVILMLDATIALEKQDLSIANNIVNEGRGLVIAVNKIDLIENSKKYEQYFFSKIENLLSQLKGIAVVFISAVNQYRLNEVLDKVIEIYFLWNKTISTGHLNRWLIEATKNHRLPMQKKLGRAIKLKYITQIRNRPPTFKIFSNYPNDIAESYVKYLLNSLREKFVLPGIPIRIYFCKTANPYKE